MSQPVTELDPQQALRERLGLLEDELRALRRELSAADGKRSLGLDPPFDILQVCLGDDVYGLPITAVAEIVRYARLTKIADVPRGVVGALNLRGVVHAILDGRMRFGLDPVAPRLGTSIAMLNVGHHCVGLVVDRVLDVATVDADQLEPVRGPLSRALGVLSLATLDANIVQIIDIDRLLDADALGRVSEALDSLAPGEQAPATADQGAVNK